MLRTLSHKHIAILISLIGAFMSTIFFGATLLYSSLMQISYIVFTGLSVFIILYVVCYYAIKQYIVQKVIPIYKTIHNTQTKSIKKISKDPNDNINIVAKTEEEVQEWAKRKTKEIEELRKLEEYRKEYIGNVSHELKTPIFNIQGYLLTLLDGGMDDPTINRKYLEKAEKAIDRMTSIVKDLEAISRLESGELVLQYEIFDLRSLILEVFDAQEFLAKEKNISLSFKKGNEGPRFVKADRKRISQVITNLIVNSIKYGVQNGKTEVGFYSMDNFLLVEVKDNGIGMAENHLSRIFERFYRVDKSRSREQGGTGLGLSIVKHVIEAHNQSINVKSKPNTGTSFTFTLEIGSVKEI